jgi:hypothetical protein
MSGQYADKTQDSELLSTYFSNIEEHVNHNEVVNLIIQNQEEVFCNIRTISTIMREEKVERIDLLKIDVEKAELKVLLGIEDQDWCKINQIVIEVHDIDNRLEIIKAILLEKGYSVEVREQADLKNTGLYVVTALREPIMNKFRNEDPDAIYKDNAIYEMVNEQRKNPGLRPFISTDDLASWLNSVLPEYMVPSAFIELDSFPLNANGKIDTNALPDPVFNALSNSYTAPSNESEAAVCTVWQEVLGLDKVGISDDFFKIGGNSILAIQVSHRMSLLFGCEVKVADVFRFKCIRNLVENIRPMDVPQENVEKEF